MDIAELPEALAALARDLEQRDDDPFTLRCHAAVLLAERTLEERMTAEEAIRAMGAGPSEVVTYNLSAAPMATLRDRLVAAADVYSEHPPIFGLFFEAAEALAEDRAWLEQAVGHPGPPASEQEDYSPRTDLSEYRAAILERLDNELRFHQELMEIRRTLLGPDHYKIARSTSEALAELLRVADRLRVQAAEEADIQRRAPSATLLRLASHLLPTFASDEAEMDSPEVDLEAFGIGREDPEAKLLLEHMKLSSGDAGWPHFPVAYVARGLSSYLLAVSKATRRAAMGIPAPAPSIDLLGFEAALHAAKTPEEKRRVFKQSIPLAKGR